MISWCDIVHSVWSCMFDRSCQSSKQKLERLFCNVSVKEAYELWALNCGKTFENVTSNVIGYNCTRWGRLCDHTHEQHFVLSPSVSRLITFSPTSWLLLPWQASPPGKVRSDAAHPVISTPHRLRTSEILIPNSVSSAVTHRCHHRPALPFQDKTGTDFGWGN